MAPKSLLIFLTLLLATCFLSTSSATKFIKPIHRSGHKLQEKLSHLRLYWHDILSGPHPTGAMIIPPLNNSITAFGLVRMIDNPLTLGPKLSSECVGRAQGFYASAGMEELGFYMAMNFEFIKGKYNGSTISVQGRNPALRKVREMAVVGGSGLFRFARGYAMASTHWIDFKTGDAVVEYNVYVLHY
ncbi:unnamed protein product [Rhodiola kirilowii]